MLLSDAMCIHQLILLRPGEATVTEADGNVSGMAYLAASPSKCRLHRPRSSPPIRQSELTQKFPPLTAPSSTDRQYQSDFLEVANPMKCVSHEVPVHLSVPTFQIESARLISWVRWSQLNRSANNVGIATLPSTDRQQCGFRIASIVSVADPKSSMLQDSPQRDRINVLIVSSSEEPLLSDLLGAAGRVKRFSTWKCGYDGKRESLWSTEQKPDGTCHVRVMNNAVTRPFPTRSTELKVTADCAVWGTYTLQERDPPQCSSSLSIPRPIQSIAGKFDVSIALQLAASDARHDAELSAATLRRSIHTQTAQERAFGEELVEVVSIFARSVEGSNFQPNAKGSFSHTSRLCGDRWAVSILDTSQPSTPSKFVAIVCVVCIVRAD
ncbi:uncharacterized protein BJ171DRAFT_471463 [Polychytrium aggregatum]|uniref:uncharacterized protein n=1 Tax=Polychytrium aggregatum TaxID=110093 RepID=UPI0022FDED6E|nr:uncharacterized protein BJ171DRAFT_471463 [Polychytrium aggregatum]KAI9208415.1 hypothetical protein BJ171DRAFT_471463 [Polychytrium aggregatum]